MISAPRKTNLKLRKTSKVPNPYAWRQGRQLWSLFAGLWIFSGLILGAAILLVHKQYAFFIEHAYKAFPNLVPYLEREAQVAYMLGFGALFCWTPVLYALCHRWTKQTFDPLIFFHHEINSMVLTAEQSKKHKPVFPIGEFHEFYQTYQTFFAEMRKNRITEAEAVRKILELENPLALREELKIYLRRKESELGSNMVYLSKDLRPSSARAASLDVNEHPRRVS